MTGSPLITLSIVSHGNTDKIATLLTSIQKHEPNTASFQVILTDNLGNDLPTFASDSWQSLQTMRNQKRQGFAHNHNRAFELAKGDYFAVLNPDLIFQKAVFDKLLSTLQTHQAHFIAPQVVDAEGNAQDSFRPLPSPAEIIYRRLPGYSFDAPRADANGLVHPDWIAAMFWLMPSSTYRTLHGMDEKFRLYFEDVDFCTRAKLQGMKIIVDTHSQVRHDAQRSSRKNAYYLFLHTQSALRFFTSQVYKQARQKH
jgi:N-acetylglucosaminyl-diphospho-decaprenol L-rhamnosyltransferase